MARHRLKRNLSFYSQRAAHILEVALVAPILILMILGTLDLGSFFYRHNYLTYVVHRAADKLAKLEVEVDTSQKNCPTAGNACASSNASSGTECVNYLARVQAVLDEAVQSAKLVMDDSNVTTGTHLYAFRHYVPGDYVCDTTLHMNGYGNGMQEFTSDIGFQRPGERLRLLDGANSTYVEHPTRPCSSSSDPSINQRCGFKSGSSPSVLQSDTNTSWPFPGQTWSGELQKHPLIVRARFRYSPITPIGGFDVNVTQSTFRLTAKFGFGVPSVEQPTNTPLPTITGTPTITPTPTDTIAPCQRPECLDPHKLEDCAACASYGCPCNAICPTFCNRFHNCQLCETFTGCNNFNCPTPTITRTPTETYTPSQSPTPSQTYTPSHTPTITATGTDTPIPPTPTQTFTPSITPTVTQTYTPSKTPTVTATSTVTKTPTAVPTPTYSCQSDCGPGGCAQGTCHTNPYCCDCCGGIDQCTQYEGGGC